MLWIYNVHTHTLQLSCQPPNLVTADTSVARGLVWADALSLQTHTYTLISSLSVSCIAPCLSWQMWPLDQALTNSSLLIWEPSRSGSGTCCSRERGEERARQTRRNWKNARLHIIGVEAAADTRADRMQRGFKKNTKRRRFTQRCGSEAGWAVGHVLRMGSIQASYLLSHACCCSLSLFLAVKKWKSQGDVGMVLTISRDSDGTLTRNMITNLHICYITTNVLGKQFS